MSTPVVEWFSAKRAIDSAINACMAMALECDLSARNASSPEMVKAAAAWRVNIAVLQAFVAQYADANPSRPLEAARNDDAVDPILSARGTDAGPRATETPNPSPSLVSGSPAPETPPSCLLCGDAVTAFEVRHEPSGVGVCRRCVQIARTDRRVSDEYPLSLLRWDGEQPRVVMTRGEFERMERLIVAKQAHPLPSETPPYEKGDNMKDIEPCAEGWESADPGAGSFSPNPCVRCGWSQEDHGRWEARRDVANEVLIAINETLAIHGLSVARTQNRRGDEFAYTVLALPRVEP